MGVSPRFVQCAAPGGTVAKDYIKIIAMAKGGEWGYDKRRKESV